MKISGYLLIILLFIFSCKKDTPEEANEVLIIGDASSMNITDQIRTINDTYDLDLNKDSIPDFRLIYNNLGIMCLNQNSLVMGQSTPDTLFLHQDAYSHENFDSIENYKILSFLDRYYQPYQTDSKDAVIRTLPAQVTVIASQNGDLINRAGTFKCDTFPINKIIYATLAEEKTTPRGDTLFFERTYVGMNNLRKTFPVNRIFYIGCKLNTSNGEKLGWIKLLAANDYLLLLSYAIQK